MGYGYWSGSLYIEGFDWPAAADIADRQYDCQVMMSRAEKPEQIASRGIPRLPPTRTLPWSDVAEDRVLDAVVQLLHELMRDIEGKLVLRAPERMMRWSRW